MAVKYSDLGVVTPTSDDYIAVLDNASGSLKRCTIRSAVAESDQTADSIEFDGSSAGISADNVQDAIIEVASGSSSSAETTTYEDEDGRLGADNVQDALDTLASCLTASGYPNNTPLFRFGYDGTDYGYWIKDEEGADTFRPFNSGSRYLRYDEETHYIQAQATDGTWQDIMYLSTLPVGSDLATLILNGTKNLSANYTTRGNSGGNPDGNFAVAWDQAVDGETSKFLYTRSVSRITGSSWAFSAPNFIIFTDPQSMAKYRSLHFKLKGGKSTTTNPTIDVRLISDINDPKTSTPLANKSVAVNSAVSLDEYTISLSSLYGKTAYPCIMVNHSCGTTVDARYNSSWWYISDMWFEKLAEAKKAFIQEGEMKETPTRSSIHSGTTATVSAMPGPPAYQKFYVGAAETASGGASWKFSKVDLTNCSQLIMVAATAQYDSENSNSSIYIVDSSGNKVDGYSATFQSATPTRIIKDISVLSGEYSIVVGAYAREGNNSHTLKVYELYLA